MSTANIPQTRQVRGQLKSLGGNAKNRSRKLREELEQLDAEEDDILTGSAAALQSLEDDRGELMEEGEQLATILGRFRPAATTPPSGDGEIDETTPPPVTTEPDDELVEDIPDDATFTRSEFEGMTNARLSLIANSYGMDAPVNDHFDRWHTIRRIIEAQHRWCVENDMEDPNEERRTIRSFVNQSDDKRIVAIILAVLVGFVVFLIMRNNIDTILSWGVGDEDWSDNGFIRFVTLFAPPILVGYLVWAYAKDLDGEQDE